MQEHNGKEVARAKDKPGIPDFLKALPYWIGWDLKRNEKSGKWTKVPRGSVLDAAFPKPFDAVADFPVSPKQGVGLVFTGGIDRIGYRLISLDVDACREPKTGALSPWAEELLNHYGRPFTEITPSRAGLRVWLWVEKPPKALPRIRLPFDAPEGVDKQPEIQVFGLGSAQYVTVTGDVLPGCSDLPAMVPHLGWLQKRYKVDEQDDKAPDMPKGDGATPAAELIEERMQASCPDGMLDGDWDAAGVDSASELWYRLVKHALKAADNHGEAAADFLLTSTAWGHGLVDSRDPDRYARPDWVYADVARVATKAGDRNPSDVFQPIAGDFETPTTPEKAPRASRLVSAAEFAANVEAQRFLVYGHLPARGLAQFYGDPGCGKTPYALSLALHVAGGLPTWFGHDVERHGSVVYMVGEDAGGIRDRMVAQCDASGLKVEDLDMHVSTMPAKLLDPMDVLEWVKDIKAACAGSCALLVVDTQQANFGPGNENSTEDAGNFLDNLKAVTRHLGCLVLLVHHTGHAEKGRGRGSSAIPGAMDAQFVIERSGRGMVVTASPTKSKNWKDPEPLIGLLTAVEIGNDSKGRPITAVTLADEPPDPAAVFGVVDGLAELLPLLEIIDELDGKPTTQTELGKLEGSARGEFRSKLADAIEHGFVEKKGGGKGKTRTTFELTAAGRLYLQSVDRGDADDLGGLLE